MCQATQVQEGRGDTGHAWFMLLVMEGEDRIRPGLLRGSKSLGRRPGLAVSALGGQDPEWHKCSEQGIASRP